MPGSAPPDRPPLRIGLLLVPTFAVLPYAATVDPLRAANLLSQRRIFEWTHLTADGGPIAASNGLQMMPEGSLREDREFDAVFVFAGTGVERVRAEPYSAWLQRQAGRKIRIAGISGGTLLLARAGLLDGYRCTVHWDHVAGLTEAFPFLEVTDSLFEIDRDRLTCSGGIAPLDLMRFLLEDWGDAALARAVSDWFLHREPRPGHTRQDEGTGLADGVRDPRLRAAVALMRQSLEEPLPRAEIAARLGLSVRHLDRLARAGTDLSLAQLYRALRLRRARSLLQQTDLSITEVAVACGFANASHFSRAYRRQFGQGPRQQRAGSGSSARGADR